MKKPSDRIDTNVTVISYVTRRLIAGPDEIFAERMTRELDVRLNMKKSGEPHVNIKGRAANIRVAESLIRTLDQHAALTAKNEVIKTTGGVEKKHFELLRPTFELLLREAILELNPDTAKIAAPSSPPPLADAPNTPSQKPPQNASRQEGTAEKPKARKILTVAFNDASFAPRNLSQAITYLASKDMSNSYVFAAGPFGGGKTFTPLRAGFEGYNEGKYAEIILIRPSASTGRDMGAMPGNARSKIDPYIKGGLASNIEKMTTTKMAELEKKGVLRVLTPDFERGETYDNAFILVDEPQNLTMQQAELLIGRLGEGSKMVFAGDIGGNQNDLKGQLPGLVHLIATQGAAAEHDKILRDGTAFIQFKDSDSAARNPILPHVAAALNKPPGDYAALVTAFNSTRNDARVVHAIEQARNYAVMVLEKAAKATELRYERDMQSRFPKLYEENRPQFQNNRQQLRIA